MSKPIIAVDIDDVLADSTEALRQRVNERFKLELTQENYRIPGEYWGYYERVWRAHNLPDLVLGDMEVEMEVDQLHVPLLSGASVALGELSKQYDLVIVTARYPEWEAPTRRWLKHHFGDGFVDLHFTKSHKEDAHKTKGEICQQLGAQWLIDDNEEHCSSALHYGVQAILFGNYGWHSGSSAHKGMVNCKDWQAVLEYFNALD